MYTILKALIREWLNDDIYNFYCYYCAPQGHHVHFFGWVGAEGGGGVGVEHGLEKGFLFESFIQMSFLVARLLYNPK